LGVVGFVTICLDYTRHHFAGPCYHMWTDSLEVLLIEACGTARKWQQNLHKAFWQHFDIARSKCKLAIIVVAVHTGRDCLVAGPARRKGVRAKLDQIVRVEARTK
jgi:hypothetical protein